MEPLPIDQQRDPITGLQTRAAFDARLRGLDSALGAGGQAALLILDIDYFKSVNDAFGHRRGDQVLGEVAGRLAGAVRAADHLFRIGGDEFALVVPAAGREEARALGQRLLATVRGAPCAGDPPLTLSISVGAAALPDDGAGAEDLFLAADRRHYMAKRAGRAQVVADDIALAESALDPPSRLIERDSATAAVRQLLAPAVTHDRALLHLRGPAGAGRTRMLAEIATMAAMLGYGVLPVQGSQALRSRLFGALARACAQAPELRGAAPGGDLTAAMQGWAERGRLRGLVVTVDDLADIDAASLDLLCAAYESRIIQHLTFAVAADDLGPLERVAAHTAARATIVLTPLSEDGLRAWLRQCLRWEAPPEVVSWLAEQTDGLPGPLWRTLGHLLASRVLAPVEGGWQLHGSYRFIPIGGAARQRRPPLRIPAGLPEMVGREDEIEQLARLVRRRRLVSVVGPGGLGKTRLAIQVGAEVGEQMPGGMAFVSLAGASSLERVLPTIAEAVGGVGSDEPAAVYEALRQRAMVLVVDNLEHLGGVEGLLRELLEQTEALRLLVTSRERLTLAEAGTLELGGLALPAGAGEEDLAASSAAQLFLRRARQIDPGYELSEEDRPALAQLCRLLEGMPLALELAAGWVHTGSCRAIVERVAANLAAPAESELAPGGQRSVLAAVATFWERLSTGEQAVLRRLGLFRSGFGEEAGRAVAGASPFFLSALVVSGYLRRAPDGRYEMHELLRQYAELHLRRAPHDRLATEERFADHYAGLVERSGAALLAGGEALRPLEREIANVVAVWEWCLARERLDALARMAPGVARYWELRGQLNAGAAVIDRTLPALRARAGDPRARELLAHLLCRRAWYCAVQYNLDSPLAIELADEALAAAGEGPGRAEALLLSGLSRRATEPEEALAALEQAAALDAPDAVRGEVVRFMGVVASEQGDMGRSEGHYARALAIFQRAGDRLGQVRTLISLTYDDIQQERLSRAGARAEQTLALARAAGLIEGEVFAYVMRGDVLAYLGDFSAAQGAYDIARLMAREAGLPDVEQIALHHWCSVLCQAGDAPQAEALCREALALAARMPDNADTVYFQVILAHLDLAAGRHAEARARYDSTFAVLTANHDRIELCLVQAGLVRSTLAAGDTAAALAHAARLLQAVDGSLLAALPFPFAVCEAVGEALAAAGDPRAARAEALAAETLRRRAEGIDDPGARAAYEARMRARHPILGVRRAP